MYQGNNPTALQSQKLIIDALLSLMKQKSFSSINIKELCEKALVSRQTFYTLFQTKEHVIELHFDRLFADYALRLQTSEKVTISEICNSAISYLLAHREFLLQLAQNNLGYILTAKLEEYLLTLGNLLHAPKKHDEAYAMAFIAGALSETLFRYVKNDADCNPANLSALIEEILTGQYFVV